MTAEEEKRLVQLITTPRGTRVSVAIPRPPRKPRLKFTTSLIVDNQQGYRTKRKNS